MAAPNNMTTQPFINQATGGIYLDNGNITSDGQGNLSFLGALLTALQMSATGAVATPTGAAQTIATGTLVSRTAPSGACTNAILAAGTKNGQIVVVTNEQTVVANSITFNTAVATGLVLTNATPTAVTIGAATAAIFMWLSSLNGGAGAWVHIAAA